MIVSRIIYTKPRLYTRIGLFAAYVYICFVLVCGENRFTAGSYTIYVEHQMVIEHLGIPARRVAIRSGAFCGSMYLPAAGKTSIYCRFSRVRSTMHLACCWLDASSSLSRVVVASPVSCAFCGLCHIFFWSI